MKQLPLSIIILTDRSDSRFLKALESAQFAEEVLVVDNKSGNDWDKLSKKFSFKVVKHENPIDNFAEVRNKSMQRARFDWVLFLDSDEELQTEAASQVEELMASGLYDGVNVTRQDVFLGRVLHYGEAGSMQIMRLFKKDLSHFNHTIHETAKVNGRIGSSDLLIKHYAHPSISEFMSDISWYAERVAFQRSPDRASLIFQMLFYPPAKFLLNFVLKLGFLDGWRGLVYAVLMSIHSFSVRVFVYEQQKSSPTA